jgi:hypothetical protein
MSRSHESLPLHAHLASRRGLELDDAVLRHCRTGRDQLDELDTVLPGECCGTDPAGVATRIESGMGNALVLFTSARPLATECDLNRAGYTASRRLA